MLLYDDDKDNYQRPLKNAPFFPILASDLKFNPRNIPYIPVVKFLVFLELGQKMTFFKGLYQLLPNLDFRIREGRISQWLSTGTELILN